MSNVYADDDPSNPAEPDETALPGLAAAAAPGLDAEELIVDGERFVVTRRANSSGTYDFDWTNHSASYGFSLSTHTDWNPSRAELVEQIRNFLADIDPETGYLRD